MIEINLLPEELRKRRHISSFRGASSVSIGKLPWIRIMIFIVAVLIAAHAVLFLSGLALGSIFKSLEYNYKKILPEKKEAEQFKTDISNMSKKISAIDELMVKRFSWARKLNDLSNSVTAGIWLTQLGYDEKIVEKPRAVSNVAVSDQTSDKQVTEKFTERYLIISGAASSMGEEGTALIGRFIKNLKENSSFYSDFSDIELGNIKREQSSGQEIMTFKITCLFKAKR